MSKEILISAFSSIAHISEEEKGILRSIFTSLKVPARTILVTEGEIAHSVYFIIKGVARIGINCPTGEDISCYLAQENQWIGVYESFLTGDPSEYFVQTIEDCEFLVADRMGIQDMYDKVRNGNLIGRKLAEGFFMQTVMRLTDFYKFTPEERFQNFIEQYPGLANRIPQHCLASFIGVKPQSLSRIKKRVFSAE